MGNTDTIILHGRAYSWAQILELRQRQLADRKSAPGQPALFELIEDRRPAMERSAAGRSRCRGLGTDCR